MKLSPKISELIDSLKSLPGIGPKSAKRMALSLLSSNKEIGLLLAKSIEDAIFSILSPLIAISDSKILPSLIRVPFFNIKSYINLLN